MLPDKKPNQNLQPGKCLRSVPAELSENNKSNWSRLRSLSSHSTELSSATHTTQGQPKRPPTSNAHHLQAHAARNHCCLTRKQAWRGQDGERGKQKRNEQSAKSAACDLNVRMHLNTEETRQTELQAQDMQLCSDQRGLRVCLGLAHQAPRQTPQAM